MQSVGGGGHREQDEKDGERKNGTKVGAKISPRGVNRRGIKERREKQIEDELGIEVDCGKSGHQSEQTAGNGEEDGIRDVDFPRDDREQRDSHEANQD